MSEVVEGLPPAEEGAEPTSEEPTEQLITMQVGTEWYGLPIEKAREVIRARPVTALPGVPSPIAGIITLRGEILSVTDLARVFRDTAASMTLDSRLVVVAADGMETALLVDRVGEVAAVPVRCFEPPLSTLDPAHAELIDRMCRWQERLMAVVRVERLLALGAVTA